MRKKAHGLARLVAMSGGGERAGESQRRVGVQGHAHAGRHRVRQPGGRHDHRRGGRAVPCDARADQGRPRVCRTQSGCAPAWALMRVLFDNGTPRGVAAALREHTVEEARARGWDTLRNGELLDAAEAAGFDVFVTTDRNIPYQQNLTGRQIAVVVLTSGRWRLIKEHLADVISLSTGAP